MCVRKCASVSSISNLRLTEPMPGVRRQEPDTGFRGEKHGAEWREEVGGELQRLQLQLSKVERRLASLRGKYAEVVGARRQLEEDQKELQGYCYALQKDIAFRSSR